MQVIATFYANTGNIEDDILFSFRTPYYLNEGMKLKYDGELYEIQESFLDCDNSRIECIFKRPTP